MPRSIALKQVGFYNCHHRHRSFVSGHAFRRAEAASKESGFSRRQLKRANMPYEPARNLIS